MKTPNSYNIAVLGAGIMGLCAARELGARGHAVSLFDPDSTHNASALAGGMLAPYGEIEHMPLAYIEAAREAISFWRARGGSFAQNGGLFIAHAEDRHMLERFRAHLPEGVGENVESLRGLEPDLAVKFSAALYIESEAHLDPRAAMQDLREELKARSAKFFNVICANESAYDFVIDCRGLGADDLDLRGVKGEMLLVRNPGFSLARPVRLMHPRYPLYIVPREDNIFMIGATVLESAGDHVSVRSALELLSAAYSLQPSFGDAEILEMRAGVRPAYADNLPRVKIKGNRLSCNGLFRHGFLLAPVMAACTADHVDGKTHRYMSLFDGETHERNDQRRPEDVSRAA